MFPDQQLELGLFVSPDVTVTRLPDGEVRLRPKAPLVTGGTREAARALAVDQRTILRMIEAGEIRAWRPAKRHWRIDMTSVYDLLNQRKAKQER